MIDEPIERIIIVDDKLKANLKRNVCSKCGRIYFMKVTNDGNILEPCPVCLGLFDN